MIHEIGQAPGGYKPVYRNDVTEKGHSDEPFRRRCTIVPAGAMVDIVMFVFVIFIALNRTAAGASAVPSSMSVLDMIVFAFIWIVTLAGVAFGVLGVVVATRCFARKRYRAMATNLCASALLFVLSVGSGFIGSIYMAIRDIPV